jgi:hypothetical protein
MKIQTILSELKKEGWVFDEEFIINNEDMLQAISNKTLALQLQQTGVSGSFISDAENLTSDIEKYFPKFFDDFTNFEYGTGVDAGKDFKKIFNKAKRLKTKIGKNYR